jgi:uncharacterized protein (TIGR03437 family)
VLPLPTILGGTNVVVKDSTGVSRSAALFYVSPLQVNYEVPLGTTLGPATVTAYVNGYPVASGPAQIAPVAPGIYTADGSGKGVAAGDVVTLHADGTVSRVSIAQCSTSGCTGLPIDLGAATDRESLELFGTGIRGHSTPLTASIGGANAPVTFAGPQGSYSGLDQVNVSLPQALRGAGSVTLILTVDGQSANAVGLTFK